MKTMITILALSIATTTAAIGQSVVLSEAFDTAFPVNWTQHSDDGVMWERQPDLGTYGTGCAIADQGENSEQKSGLLQTPFVDLTAVDKPTISFTTALVQNNFAPPNVSLWYDIGNGWQRLRQWGLKHYGADEDIEHQTENFGIVLRKENVRWVELNYDVEALASHTHIRFAFGADFVNGGWVLIDKVLIRDNALTSVAEQHRNNDVSLRIYPNPTSNKLYVESHAEIESITIVDAQGQKVQEVAAPFPTKAGIELDIRALAKGTYFLHITTNNAAQPIAIRKFAVL